MHSFFSPRHYRLWHLSGGILGCAVFIYALCPLHAQGAVSPPTLEAGVVRNASAIVPEPDGKVVAAGEQPDDGTPMILLRLRANGKVDPTFDASGLRLLSLDSITRLPNGKFLLAGSFAAPAGEPQDRLVKLNSDGRVDARFLPGDAFAPAPLVQSDGRILLLGSLKTAAGAVPTLSRLHPNGTVDATFHSDAVLLAGSAYGLKLQADGKVLVIGEDGASAGQPNLQRLKSDGALDPNFHAAAPVDGGYGVCALAVAPDGKLLVAEYANRDDAVCTLNRLKVDGSLDPEFQAPAPLDGSIEELAADGVGRVVFAGDFTQVNGVARAGFARLHKEGGLDRSFDPLSSFAGFDGFVASRAGSVTYAQELSAAESAGSPTPEVVLEELSEDGTSVTAEKISACPACELVAAAHREVYVRVKDTANDATIAGTRSPSAARSK